MDIKTVSGMLGRFPTGFTLDTYAHVPAAAQKEAAQTMGNVLGSYYATARRPSVNQMGGVSISY